MNKAIDLEKVKDDVLVRRIGRAEQEMARWNFVMGGAIGFLMGACLVAMMMAR